MVNQVPLTERLYPRKPEDQINDHIQDQGHEQVLSIKGSVKDDNILGDRRKRAGTISKLEKDCGNQYFVFVPPKNW